MTGNLIGTALVTGAAGFIGSALTRALLDVGGRVIAVDNLVNGTAENLAGLRPDHLRFEQADIRDRARIEALLPGVDVIYHLACLGVRHSIHSPRENHDVNATGTLDLLAMARAAGVGRFVYVSSSEVYGTARAAPMTETHPTFPMTVYGAGKLAGECYARSYWETYDYPTVMVRPFNAFGPRCHHEGDSGEVIPKFMLRAMAGQPLLVFGDGEQTRDFTYVEDTARGILAAGHAADAIGRTINLGSGAEVTINVLAGMISNLVAGGRAEVRYEPPRPGDVLRLIADAREAEIRLGFAPQVSLQDGLNALHAWYLMERHSPVEMLRDEIAHNWRGDVKAEASNGRSD